MVLSSSEKKAKQSISELLSLCHTLGIVINEKRSDLVPSQSAKYLGIFFFFFFYEWEQNGQNVPFLESASLEKRKRSVIKQFYKISKKS